MKHRALSLKPFAILALAVGTVTSTFAAEVSRVTMAKQYGIGSITVIVMEQ